MIQAGPLCGGNHIDMALESGTQEKHLLSVLSSKNNYKFNQIQGAYPIFDFR